jgi:hypothetical protein
LEAWLNYIVTDIPNHVIPDAHCPTRAKPRLKRSDGNNKEITKTDLTNPFPKSLPAAQGATDQAQQWQYTAIGRQAVAAGQCAVFVGSAPYEAWRQFRGDDGMPGFVDQAVIDGKLRKIVWMPTVFPPKGPARNCSGQGGGQTLED